MITNHQSFTLLLAEDDEDDTFFFERAVAINYPNCVICPFSCGEDLLSGLNRKIDDGCVLVFLDLAMPRLSGLQTMIQIRQNKTWLGLPIFMLTALEAEAHIDLAYQWEVNGYLFKPASPYELAQNLKHAIQYAFRALV